MGSDPEHGEVVSYAGNLVTDTCAGLSLFDAQVRRLVP